MRLRRSRHPRIAVFVLVLALAGLLAMHGFDAGGVTHGLDGEPAMSSTVRHDMQPGHGAGGTTGARFGSTGSERSIGLREAGHTDAAGSDARPGQVGWGHVVVLCVVVLATIAAGAVRRLLVGVRVRSAAGGTPSASGSVGPPRVFRPPGPGRLELCVLTC